MIQLKELLTSSQVLANVNVASKKRALEVIAKTVVTRYADLDEQTVFEQLVERERLGTTGFGKGVGIPHCRLEDCKEPVVVVLKLIAPIDFNAVDDQPVDLLISLVVPAEATDDHLQLLRQIAELLSDAELCRQMRDSTSGEELYQVIMNGVS